MTLYQPPWHWPVMFAEGRHSQFHWDEANAVYRCLDCGEIREEP